jgi:hypothetical protein
MEHIKGESTLRGGPRLLSLCTIFVLFLKGFVFELQPCHYYEKKSQFFYILW